MGVTAAQWLARFADELGVPAPSAEEVETLLSLAGVAAHSSERIAAPVACWMAARAGVDPEQAAVIARSLEVWSEPGDEPS
jgi:hypothetical protein